MRFRTTELFLGAFLSVSIFALGMLFASSWPDAKQAAQTIATQSPDKHGEKTKTPDEELIGSTWLTKDAAGFFAFMLFVVGVGQAFLFYVQLGGH